ncbi:MAG: hypothetical protein KI790_13930 [Cyclobacteriaceae bacterium]|nr:hypothetical protein [Cyclobacteriaceae bacterium HetDA_MAG_MS6]
MKFQNRRRWRIIRGYGLGWTLAFAFLTIVRGVGTTELGSVQFDTITSLVVAGILGPTFGAISGFGQIITEERLGQRISIWKLLVWRLFFAIVFLLAIILASYVLIKYFFGISIALADYMVEPGSFPIYFYILCVDSFLSTVRQVSLMIGDNNLGKLLRGKFYQPREEQRIFMFLDLQASTELAEELGHLKYSMFIQDCFNDLGVVVENEAEVYQYVGDEAILTWTLRDGVRRQNCIRAFFRFKKQLQIKADYYREAYGHVPVFKAGLHGGPIIVTEVGKYKKEIAYHGDAINTAARIRSQCNAFNQELLISEYIQQLLSTNDYGFKEMDNIVLKGKKEQMTVFAVFELHSHLPEARLAQRQSS